MSAVQPDTARHDSDPFDPLTALDALLACVGLDQTATGGTVSFVGEDPIVPAVHRLGACIGVPLMAAAVATVGLHRLPRWPGPGPSPRSAPGRAHHQPGRLLASDGER